MNMYALEFETDITSEYIRIPNYKQLKNQHVRVILLSETLTEASLEVKGNHDFSDLAGRLQWEGDVIAEQQRLRNEWY